MEELNKIEQKYLAQKAKIRKRKRRRRILRTSVAVIVVLLIALYLSSDLSKVNTLIVQGNHYYSKEEILEIAQLDYDSSYILTNRFLVAYRLKKDDLIKESHVSKDWKGNILIEVEEEKIVGSLISDPSTLILAGSESVIVKNSKNELLVRIGNFDSSQLEKLSEGFKGLDLNILDMISEVHPYRTSYDDDMLQLIMQDGNRVTTTYNGIVLLNSYPQVLEKLQGTHVCLYADEFSNTIFKESDDCRQGLVLPSDAVSIPPTEEQKNEVLTEENAENELK